MIFTLFCKHSKLKKDNKLSSPDNAYLETLIRFVILFLLLQPLSSSEKMMPVSEFVRVKNPKHLEITELEKCYPDIYPKYGTNSNHIINNGKKVYQKIIRVLSHRIIVDSERYFLSQIEWHKSVFFWKGQDIGLDLHLIHTSSTSDHSIRIIFPLNLVDGDRTYFSDISFDKNIKNVTTLNSLIVDQSYVPSYTCCSPNLGRIVRFNLEPLANLIRDQENFYKYVPSKQSLWFITKPQYFNRSIGLVIRDRLEG